MQILAIDRFFPGTTMEKVQPHLKEEMMLTWEHYKQGKIRQLYFRQDHPGVVLMMESDSLEEAQELLDELPLVKQRLIEFEIIPLGYFEPLETLFGV
jgi:muconolactone delta-isomerase